MRRLNTVFLFFIALILFSHNLLADPLYEDMRYRRTSRKLYAIVLRATPRSYTVATGNGLQVLDRGTIQRIRPSVKETERLSTLLNSVEAWIRKSRFPQAEEELPRLEEALEAYKKLVAAKATATTSSADFKAAIQHSLKYYRSEIDEIEPTIKALKVSQQIIDLADQLKKKDVDHDSLMKMAKAFHELNSITQETPLAKRDREKASRVIRKQISRCQTALVEKALGDVRRDWNIAEVRKLLQTLKRCSEYDPKYEEVQAQIIEPFLKAAGEFTKTLPVIAKASFKFDIEPNMDASKLRAPRQKLKDLNSSLKYVKRHLFGKTKDKLIKQIDERIALNNADKDKALAVRDNLQRIVGDYISAQTLNRTSKFKEAAAAFEALKVYAEKQGVLTQEFSSHLDGQVNSNTGRDILSRLRDSSTITVPQINSLIDEAKKYLRRHSARLESYRIEAARFDQRIGELQAYLGFEDKFQRVRKGDASARTDLFRLLKLKERLGAKPPIHSRAKAELDAFIGDKGIALHSKAIAELKAGEFDLENDRDQETLVSMIIFLQKRGDLYRGTELSAKAYELVKGDHEHKLLKKLLRQDITAARLLAEQNKFKLADQVYARIRERFPSYSAKRISEDMLGVLKSQAEKQTKTNIPLAIKTYTKICKDGKDYADRHGIFNTLLNLRGKAEPELADRLKRRELLEAFCKDYGYRLRKTDMLQAEKAQIVADYERAWVEDEAPVVASERFIELVGKYPAMISESQVATPICKKVHKLILTYRQKLAEASEADDAGTPTVVIPNKIVQGIEKLMVKEVIDEARRHNLVAALVEFRIAQAKRSMQLGEVETGFRNLEQIQRRFPREANNNKVAELLQGKKFELLLEQIRTPLGIRNQHQRWILNLPAIYVDTAALAFWVLFWFVYLINAFKSGRHYGHLATSLRHFGIVLFAFALFMALFLVVGKFSHSTAVLVSFLIPATVFNGLSMFNYAFFPLIYVRRRLNVSKAILQIPGLKGRFGRLERNVQQLETDLPLLHDRWLFRIERAIRQSNQDPEGACNTLKKIDEKLKNERSNRERMDQHHINCIFQLGRISFDLGRLDESEDYLLQHLEHDPRATDTRELLGAIYYERQQYEEAIPHLKVCLAAQGSNDYLWFRLGHCFFQTEKFKAAYKCFETVQEPDRDVMFYSARAYARVGNHKKSVEQYQNLLRMNPEDGEVIYYLASGFAQLNEDVKAFKIINVIKEDNPFYPHALGLQGSILLRNGKKDKAQEFFNQAVEAEPKLVPALHGLGQLHLEAGELEPARDCLSTLLSVEPNHAPACYYYGLVLEKQGKQEAISYFETAMQDRHFLRLAASHAARMYFFTSNYEKSVELFKSATEAGENSPWSLYLYAYGLASLRQLKECQKILIQLFGHSTDQQWRARSGQAMYSIGYKLFSQGDYHMAAQCFEYVRENLEGSEKSQRLQDLVAETRFRMIVDLIKSEAYAEAKGVVAELQLSAADPERAAICQFYMALCLMYERDYSGARQIFTSLHSEHPKDARFLYHLVVCELGLGNDKEAADLMQRLRDFDCPEHIQVGMNMIRAHMLAVIDKIKDAEQSLANLEGVANPYILQKIMLARTDYLCRIHDTARLQFLLQEMDEDTKSHAAYLQALSSLEGGSLTSAVSNLQPFASRTPENARLFTGLSAALAAELIGKGEDQRAVTVLEQVENPPPLIQAAQDAIKMASILDETETLEGVTSAIGFLRTAQQNNSDPQLGHSIIHNLGILILKQAMMVESTREKTDIEEIWQEFWDYWNTNAFEKPDYWNRGLRRICSTVELSKPFAKREIELMVASFREEFLLPMFIGFAIANLGESGQTDLMRHINYVIAMGKEDNKLNEYIQKLGMAAKKYVDSREKGDPLLKTWDFVIGYMQIQVSVRETLSPNDAGPLRTQLQTYLEFRNHYESPNDYMQARKTFNTRLLDALQQGIEGKFTRAGDSVEKSLTNIPHGIKLDQLENALWVLREYSRKPSDLGDKDINLSQEYERMYQRVLNYSLQKGN